MDPTTTALHHAATWWSSQLRGSWAHTYLQTRRLQAPAIAAGAGWATPGWTTTVDHLRTLGHTDQVLVDAGLAVHGPHSLLDRFRDRLMFPVHNSTGDLVGFLGRAAENAPADTPKWLNSPNSDRYDKSSLLYGLGESLTDLHYGAMPVVVEGAFDRFAINTAAGNIAVRGLAPCGTAFTTQHADQLRAVIGPTRPIGFAFDGDRAGRDATMRAWRTMTATATPWDTPQLLALPVPAETDPADLVKAGETQALRHAIIRAQPLAIAAADTVLDNAGRLDHLGTQYAVMRHLIQTDLPYVHPSSRQRYIMHLTRRLTLIDPMDLSTEMIAAISPEASYEATAAAVHVDQAQPTPATPTTPASALSPAEPHPARTTDNPHEKEN